MTKTQFAKAHNQKIMQSIIDNYKLAKDLNTKLNTYCLSSRFNNLYYGEEQKDLTSVCDYLGITLDITDYLSGYFNLIANDSTRTGEQEYLENLAYKVNFDYDKIRKFTTDDELAYLVLTEVHKYLTDLYKGVE